MGIHGNELPPRHHKNVKQKKGGKKLSIRRENAVQFNTQVGVLEKASQVRKITNRGANAKRKSRGFH